MARESQGLQVLLIIFVMLTVVLGVTTYLYNKQAFEKTNAAAAAATKAQQSDDKTRAVEEKFKTLATYVGHPEWTPDQIEQFTTQFAEDQKKAGVSTAAAADGGQQQVNVLGYCQMVAELSKTVDDRTVNLKLTKDQVTSDQMNFKTREAASADAVKKIDEGYGTLGVRIKQISDDNTAQLGHLMEEMKGSTTIVATAKSNASKEVAAAAIEVKNAKTALQVSEKERASALEKVRAGERGDHMDVASGEITWVSLPTKTVWINRGRADSLQRQTRFTVFSGESNDAATAVRKGVVEVTRIVADHQAECRILDEGKLTDPIMANDKIFTAFWSPGQKNHFALAGIMDLDGDGRNQVTAVAGLIRASGGEVDCMLDEQGHRQGQVSANTQFLVLGNPPDKGSQEMMKNNGDILRDKDRYHLREMTLPEFKQKMGYQKSTSVEHFGVGASSGDLNRAATAAKAAHTAKPAAATKAEDNGDAFK